VDLKPQLRAMGVANALALTATAAATDVTTAGFAVAAVGLIGTVAGPAVDVRIAGWLLHPDAGELSCGMAVQVDPVKPTLKAPGITLLKLKYDKPLSNSAFTFTLRRYSAGSARTASGRRSASVAGPHIRLLTIAPETIPAVPPRWFN